MYSIIHKCPGDLKNYVEHTAMNGVTGYKDMTEDQLKEEYISRGLHEAE
mgnify:CR=1 FL=1